MLILLMGRSARRSAVAARLAQRLGWDFVLVDDDALVSREDRIESLRARMSASQSAGRSVVYSTPSFSAADCSRLRTGAGVELVRLKEPADTHEPVPATLTLDALMPVDALVPTIVSVLKLDDAR